MTKRALRISILGINFLPEVSGIGPYTSAMARGLRECGHDVTVLTSFPHYPEWRVDKSSRAITKREVIDGVSVVRLAHYVPGDPRALSRTAFEASFGARLLASRWNDPDVLVFISPPLLSTAMALSRVSLRRRGRPAVGLVVHDIYSRGIVETGMGGSSAASLVQKLEGLVVRRADGVVAIHERMRSSLINGLSADPRRVRVIQNWSHVDPAASSDIERHSFRQALGWSNRETVVLHAGAMGAKQALESVVDAGKLAQLRGEDVRFVLLGDGSQRRKLEARAEGAALVQFLDPLGEDDFGRVLGAADVLLVNERASVSDMALPSKLTSYFRAGRPVLAATDPRSTTAEELRRSGAGIQAQPELPEALLGAALTLGNDPVGSAEMGTRGQIYSRAVLSEPAAIAEYDRWVRELASRRSTK